MTGLLSIWRLFFFLEFPCDAYYSCYVFLKKSPYDGLIKHMTFILFLQISHYDANYVYDAYSAVESKFSNHLLDISTPKAISGPIGGKMFA